MLFKFFLSLVFITTAIIHHQPVSADKLTRLWCQCSGRDIYGTISEYMYHSDRMKRDIHLKAFCYTAPEAEGIRQHCNDMALRLKKVCKKFDGDKHEFCYDRNYWGKDTVSLDGKTTKLEHVNWKQEIIVDCTEICREQWPDAVRMSSNCNYTGGGSVVPLAKNGCEFDTFTKLQKL